MFLKKNPESQGTITGGKERGTVAKKGSAAMIATIAKRGTRKTEETTAAEERTPFCYFRGKDKGHWTNECPFAIERKEEFDRLNSQPAKPVNHTSQLQP